MPAMRRVVCTFLVFLSLFQSSWAATHVTFDVANAAAQASAAAQAPELAADCAAQPHCCHPHSVGVLGEISITHFSNTGTDIAEHISYWPADISSSDIERPKWLPVSMAVAVL